MRHEVHALKILFLAWRDLANPLAGGSEVLVDALARGLVRRGHTVTLVCAQPVAPRPYQVHPNGGRYSQYVRAPLACRRHHADADLVVDVANGVPFLVPWWRRGPALCLVNHVHTEQWAQWFPRPVAALGRVLERRVLPLAYRHRLVVAVSDSTAAALESLGVAPERIRIVHNGTDLPPSVEAKSPEPLFLTLGRLVPHKRIPLALRAWERVRPVVGGRLVVAGAGPEADRLAAMAGPGVELVGQVTEDEKRRLLARAWLLLHPAMVEGWGLVVLEAAASGTPTVGLDAPGLRDSVSHGVTGMLGADLDGFTRHWLALALDAAARAEMGQRARRRAEQFTWEATAERFAGVAEEARVLHGSGRPDQRAPSDAHVARLPAGRSWT